MKIITVYTAITIAVGACVPMIKLQIQASVVMYVCLSQHEHVTYPCS